MLRLASWSRMPPAVTTRDKKGLMSLLFWVALGFLIDMLLFKIVEVIFVLTCGF